jgi:hypothetical protein
VIPDIVIYEVIVTTDDVAVNLGDDMAGGVVSLGVDEYGRSATTHIPGAFKGFYTLVEKLAVVGSMMTVARSGMGGMMEAGPMKTGGIDAEPRAGWFMSFFAPAEGPVASEGAVPVAEGGTGEETEAAPMVTDDSEAGPGAIEK